MWDLNTTFTQHCFNPLFCPTLRAGNYAPGKQQKELRSKIAVGRYLERQGMNPKELERIAATFSAAKDHSDRPNFKAAKKQQHKQQKPPSSKQQQQQRRGSYKLHFP
jgi:hypothetical protein